MSVSFNQRVKLPDDVLISDLEGESVILNLKSERYYGLDKIGTRFLTLLSKSDSIENAFEGLLAEYNVEADTLRIDLTALLLDLREQGLVEICELSDQWFKYSYKLDTKLPLESNDEDDEDSHNRSPGSF